MKQPQDCNNMQDIREAIDSIDRDIINKFGIRFEYVKTAAKFKQNTEEVKAQKRFNSMLQQRRTWAVDKRCDPPYGFTSYQGEGNSPAVLVHRVAEGRKGTRTKTFKSRHYRTVVSRLS